MVGEIMIENIINLVDLKFFTLIILTGYLFLLTKTPEKVDSFFAKFSVAFLVTFTIIQEGIDIVYALQ